MADRRVKTIKCDKCGHNQPIKKTKETAQAPKKLALPHYSYDFNSPDLPLQIKLHHEGFWITNKDGVHTTTMNKDCERNSVMFSKTCLLYVYKLALRHLLLSKKVITPEEIDAANLIPHMAVRKNKADPFSKFDQIQDKIVKITQDMISVKKHFILIEIDKTKDLHSHSLFEFARSNENLHFTLIYSKSIGDRIDLLAAFKTVLSILFENPSFIDLYQQLDYFGQNASQYWYETENSYPDYVIPPLNYVPKIDSISEDVKVSLSGSIIG